MAATSAADTRRGLGAKTNPTASAPASTAKRASSSEVLPQILIQRLMRLLRLDGCKQQFREGRAGVGLPHQALADQKSVKTRRTQPRQVLRGRDAALGYAHHAGRNALREFER